MNIIQLSLCGPLSVCLFHGCSLSTRQLLFKSVCEVMSSQKTEERGYKMHQRHISTSKRHLKFLFFMSSKDVLIWVSYYSLSKCSLIISLFLKVHFLQYLNKVSVKFDNIRTPSLRKFNCYSSRQALRLDWLLLDLHLVHWELFSTRFGGSR